MNRTRIGLVAGSYVALGAAIFVAGAAANQLLTTTAHCKCSEPAPVASAPTVGSQAVARPDMAWQVQPRDSQRRSLWAVGVVDVSTQYSATSWSAQQALGQPDVFPASGDDRKAWASLSADGQKEFITVRFAEVTQIAAATIVETFNPGAVGRVVAIASNGEETVLYTGAPLDLDSVQAQPSRMLQIGGGCTPFAVAALRVELASQIVSGWNEIDAIAVSACQ
jgi:hypothetical protein